MTDDVDDFKSQKLTAKLYILRRIDCFLLCNQDAAAGSHVIVQLSATHSLS